MNEKLYTTQEVADICAVTEWTVREWCKAGKIDAIKPSRAWRITESALKKFLNERHGE